MSELESSDTQFMMQLAGIKPPQPTSSPSGGGSPDFAEALKRVYQKEQAGGFGKLSQALTALGPLSDWILNPPSMQPIKLPGLSDTPSPVGVAQRRGLQFMQADPVGICVKEAGPPCKVELLPFGESEQPLAA